ncbi:Na+/H+ antiporter subunit G [Szabonella alba]|uniref:Na+/H+ antiporter subunit G n=1 Tax=Szabonella alba TaxID=2804194 RepID=A0A8K0V8K1_9RHOB|nr:Na+/H+ antiporter subunit G [Szabonella alba]MBL4915673.1 Na+/H+ antiporter subunit G [Szabonella alba]
MEFVAEIVISALLVMAGLFGLVGSFGLLRLPDTMTRLHAPTKATTLGVGGVLVASMIYFWVFNGLVSWQELLITMFLLLTAPITANFIAKSYLHLNRGTEKLPAAQDCREWATYAEAERAVEPVMTGAPGQDGPNA